MELVLTLFLMGFRHGFDLDHIAAITDISSSAVPRRRSLVLATAYILGHATVLIVLGGLAVVAGRSVPPVVDSVMGRVVGFTLLVLGGYVVYSLVRFRRDFSLQSRSMLILAGIKRSSAWLRGSRISTVEIEHEHPHSTRGHHHAGEGLGRSGISTAGVQLLTAKTHTHAHKHVVEVPPDPFEEYGFRTCIGVGVIHGISGETPSQLLLFTSAAHFTGWLGGMSLVLAFVAGLLLGNTVLAVAISAGFARGMRLPLAYMVLAASTAILSVVVGMLYLLGRPDLLPALWGG